MTISAAQVKELRERTGAGMMECKKALVETGGNIDAAIEMMRKSGQAKAAKKAGRTAAEGVVMINIADDGKRGVMVEINCETDFVARNDGFKALVDEITTTVFTSELPHAALVAPDGPIGSRITAEIAKVGENMAVPRTVRLTGDYIGSYSHMGGKIGVVVEGSGGVSAEALHDVALHVAAAEPRYVSRDEVTEELLAGEREIALKQAMEQGKPEEIAQKIVAGKMEKFFVQEVLLEQAFAKEPDKSVKKYLE